MNSDIADVVEIAAEVLSRRYGGSPSLTDVEDLGGLGNAIVLRARVSNTPFLSHRSVVIKYNPVSDHPIDDAALLREVVAYQFTTSLPEEVRPGPVLLAYDMDKRLVILTDAGTADTLADILVTSDDDQRREVLKTLGMELGQMHAGTAHHEADYDVLLSRLLKKHSEYAENQALRDEALRESIMIGANIIKASGVAIPDEVVALAEDSAATLQSGQQRAFTPFDLSPDNIIVSKSIHFLDYEWAGFRNVCFDVACVIAGFPQFLFSRPLSDEEAEIFQSAWAREVKSVWPRLGDSGYQDRLVVAALIGWALSSVTTMYAGGVEGVVALAQGDIGVEEDPHTSLLRPPQRGPFTEEEQLIRYDLKETFEALARFAHRWDAPEADAVVSFGRELAHRLGEVSH